MSYEKLELNLEKPITDARDELVYDDKSLLWERLVEAGAEPVGDASPFPALFEGEDEYLLGRTGYKWRRAFTEAGDCGLGGFTLLEAVQAGAEHPFWDEVNLPGPPMFWGAAAVVYTPAGFVLGKKKEETPEGVDAVFGGTNTIPAGIVGFEDLKPGRTLEEALTLASLRELEEEAELELQPDEFTRGEIFLEWKRAKQQWFGIFELDYTPDLPTSVPGKGLEFGSVGYTEFSYEAACGVDLVKNSE